MSLLGNAVGVHTVPERGDSAREVSVYSGSHVQRLNVNPGGIDADHFMSARSNSVHSRACDAGHRKLSRFAPLRSSIRIGLSLGPEGRDTRRKPSALAGAGLGLDGRTAIGASPRSASLTQRRKRFAFSPRARATAAIDTSGCWHSPTASALKNTLCRPRRRPVVTTFPVVSTCPPNPLANSKA